MDFFFLSSINSGVIWHWQTRSAYLSQSCRHDIRSYFNFLNVYLDIQDTRDAKKHQHLQSREKGILHLEKKEKKKKAAGLEREYMFFGVGSVVGPEPMFGQRCSYVPALAVGLGPSSFCALLSKQVCMVTSARWHPPTSSSIFPVSSAAAPRLSCSRRRSFFPSERERGTLTRLLTHFYFTFLPRPRRSWCHRTCRTLTGSPDVWSVRSGGL